MGGWILNAGLDFKWGVVTTLQVVQQRSMQGVDNKGHNHSTTLQYINIKYILKG
jgi:hypothetical protein